MSNEFLAKWMSVDKVQTEKVKFSRTGLELEVRSIGWEESKQLSKPHTIKLKGGNTKFNGEEYVIDLIAASLVTFDLNDLATLKQIGVESKKAAIDKLFNAGEVKRLTDVIYRLMDEEDTEEELEDLKNG
jgi:hypothetical protein